MNRLDRHFNVNNATGMNAGCKAPFVWVALILCLAIFDSRGVSTGTVEQATSPEAMKTARDVYNAGTRKLQAGKLGEAETLLQSSVSRQDERVQPVALYNLGQVRYAQGAEELKKASASKTVQGRGQAAAASGTGAIQRAAEALGGTDLQPMVEAYQAGRGVRKEIRAATQAVQRALEAHGRTLLKWRRSLGDFRSALELNAADTRAAENADFVAKEIARLVDELRQMQQAGKGLEGKQGQLDQLLAELKGRIPKENMPPGAPGGDEEEELPMESLRGLKEGPGTDGKELEMTLSPDEAGRLLDGLQSDGKLLPMGPGEKGTPRNRQGKIW